MSQSFSAVARTLAAGAWLTKDAAAARLGVSVRTIERHIDGRKLSTRLQPEPGRKPRVLVDPASIDSLAAELSAVRGGGSLAPAVPVQAPGALAAELAPMIERLAAALATAARPVPAALPAAPVTAVVRPWLTLDEAAEYSGLPRGWLLAQARAGSAIALNVGSGSRAAWRFSRERLGSVV